MKRPFLIILIPCIVCTSLSSCVQQFKKKTEQTNSPSDSEKKINLPTTRFNQINFVKDSNLNLLSEVKIKFSTNFSYPLHSLIIVFRKDSNEALLYSSIESRNDTYNISVPFNLEELKVKILSEDKKTILTEEIIKIKQGTLTI